MTAGRRRRVSRPGPVAVEPRHADASQIPNLPPFPSGDFRSQPCYSLSEAGASSSGMRCYLRRSTLTKKNRTIAKCESTVSSVVNEAWHLFAASAQVVILHTYFPVLLESGASVQDSFPATPVVRRCCGRAIQQSWHGMADPRLPSLHGARYWCASCWQCSFMLPGPR